MSKKRQFKQSEDIRRRILEIATRLIGEKGVDGLSVRQITKEMDYSAGIIYHYFDNKEDIIACVLREGYLQLLKTIKPPEAGLTPDESIRVSIRNYIESFLLKPQEYKAIMLSSSPQVLGFTSLLHQGSSEARPALMALIRSLQDGVDSGLFAPCNLELTAQAIWSAMYGLLIRLIVEQDITTAQQTKLIERQIEIILKGLKL